MRPKVGVEEGGKGKMEEMNVGLDLWRWGWGK
jgi:hypothetical protein